MRVLLIGQLPKELGGSYTTGIARVCEGLYKLEIEGAELYWYFTNVKEKKARNIDIGGKTRHYFGFVMPIFLMLKNIVSHPIDTYNQWSYYKEVNSVNPLRFEFYKANFLRVINKVKPDLIHMHSDGVPPLFFSCQRYRIPILLTFHGIMYNPDSNTWYQNKDAVLSKVKLSNYFTVLNKEVKRRALAIGVDENKIWIVPNGTNSSKFYYSFEKRNIIRKQYAVGKDTVVFITTGVVIDRKGQYDFLIWLNSLGIDYQYWIAGKGPDEGKIVEYAKNNGIETRVKMLGYIDSNEMYQYLSAADVYAHVSTTEGQAMSEIEAYSTGLHTIVRDLIKDTVIGNSDDCNHYHVITRSLTGTDWAMVAKKYGDVYNQISELL